MIETMYRPQLRADIIFGPAMLSRGNTVYHIKDPLTQWFYRIGVKEYFLLSRMNGEKSLEEIATEYKHEFNRQFDGRSWSALFQMLEKRQLLMSSDDGQALEVLKREATRRRRAEKTQPFQWRFTLVNPDHFLGQLLPIVDFAYTPVFVKTVLLLCIIFEFLFFTHLGTLLTEIQVSFKAGIDIPLYACFIVLTWFFYACHELAHGMTCKKFGGSVSEMGVIWRYLSLFPYCKLDDIVLFHNRRHRVYTAFAGTFMSLLMIFPVTLLWYFAPEGGALKLVCALLLLAVNFGSLSNFIPFVELDGYFMLSHQLDIIDLRQDAHRFLLQSMRTSIFKKRPQAVHDVKKGRKTYRIYGCLSLVYTTIFVLYAAYLWFSTVSSWLGPRAAAIVLPLLLVAMIVLSTPGKNFLQRRWHALFNK